jgi:hypothetical protein
MRRKHYYTARWAQPGQPSIGNVSFEAISDHHAKLQADKIGQQIGLPNTPRTITRDNQTIHVKP